MIKPKKTYNPFYFIVLLVIIVLFIVLYVSFSQPNVNDTTEITFDNINDYSFKSMVLK